MLVGWVYAGVLALGAGCAVMKGGAAGPEPGTRAYFEQKIRDSYALDRGELVPIATFPGRPGLVRSSSSRLLPPGFTRLPSALPAGALWLEGRVLQVMSNNFAVIGKAVTNASGAVTFPRSCLVTLAGDRQPLAAGAGLRLLAVSDGWYTYQDGSGNGTLTAYREVPIPTYEEYRRIYERDSQSAPFEPLVSVARATNANAAPQAVVPSQLPAGAPLPVAGQALPVSPLSYLERRRAIELRAQPSAWTFGDYTYATNAAGQATITGFNKDYTGALAVTNAVDGYPVTGLKDNAFLNCTNLTSVTIPASVTRIGEAAFLGCSGLGSILVDVLNPAYSSSADGVLFDAGKTRLVCYPQGKAGNYAIPSRVTNIGSWAFRDCANLTGVTIPNSVTRIEGGAFWGCSALTSVAIPASVTDVAPWAFAGCNRLTSIRVDGANPAYSSTADGVVLNREKTRIIRYPSGKKGDYAIPADIKQIGGGAFEGSMGLSGVTIPVATTVIEGGTFKNCSDLTRAVIPSTVTRISGEAFSHCSSLIALALPDKLVELGGFAFWDCTNLTSIAIPGSVARIEGSTFQGCRRLAEVTIRSGVASIDSHAFAWCGMSHVTIPASVTNIASCAFRGCTALSAIHFEGDAPGGASDTSIFCDGTASVTVYHRPDAKGWGETFGGRPAAVWKDK